jgi:hypothetical protein
MQDIVNISYVLIMVWALNFIISHCLARDFVKNFNFSFHVLGDKANSLVMFGFYI